MCQCTGLPFPCDICKYEANDWKLEFNRKLPSPLPTDQQQGNMLAKYIKQRKLKEEEHKCTR